MSDAAVHTAEALCSALYQMPFSEFLGEQDTPEGRVAWFHLGERPKDMRVSVIRPEDGETVSLRAEWRNYHADPRNPLKGEQTIRISTYAQRAEDLVPATRDAILSVLNILNDVIAETGVAGDISKLVETPEDETEE